MDGCVDVAVIGGGIAGMATALRLQAAGLSTTVLEAHGHAGGCAGYYRRQIVLHRDQAAWHAERLRRLGDALREHGLRGDRALVGLLSMLVEDTVHTGVDDAPLINATLGVTIRGAGLSRHTGGMHGFWRVLVRHYRGLGGSLRTACRVTWVEEGPGAYRLTTRQSVLTTRRQRVVALARPGVGVLLFAGAVRLGWWWLTPAIVFGVFVAVVTVTHDVVHRTIGLSPRATDWALFAMGLVLLEGGHAFRATHTQHHRLFPHPDDPEGYPAELSLPAEAAAPFTALTGGVLLLPYTPGVLVYTVMAIVGSWVYPLLTVYLPHHDHGDTPLTQTRTLRGRIIPAVFLELT